MNYLLKPRHPTCVILSLKFNDNLFLGFTCIVYAFILHSKPIYKLLIIIIEFFVLMTVLHHNYAVYVRHMIELVLSFLTINMNTVDTLLERQPPIQRHLH